MIPHRNYFPYTAMVTVSIYPARIRIIYCGEDTNSDFVVAISCLSNFTCF